MAFGTPNHLIQAGIYSTYFHGKMVQQGKCILHCECLGLMEPGDQQVMKLLFDMPPLGHRSRPLPLKLVAQSACHDPSSLAVDPSRSLSPLPGYTDTDSFYPNPDTVPVSSSSVTSTSLGR